jgi:hypothetical protein
MQCVPFCGAQRSLPYGCAGAMSWSRELEISDSRISDHLMSRAFHPKYAYSKVTAHRQIHRYLEDEHVQERPQWEIIRAFQGLAVVEHNEVPSRASCMIQSRYV